MTHDDAFLQDIIEHPDDDGLRLIYADYLDERGDPRGDFFRVQCRLAKLPEDDLRRERELLGKHKEEWLGPVRDLLGPSGRCTCFALGTPNNRAGRGFLVQRAVSR